MTTQQAIDEYPGTTTRIPVDHTGARLLEHSLQVLDVSNLESGITRPKGNPLPTPVSAHQPDSLRNKRLVGGTGGFIEEMDPCNVSLASTKGRYPRR